MLPTPATTRRNAAAENKLNELKDVQRWIIPA